MRNSRRNKKDTNGKPMRSRRGNKRDKQQRAWEETQTAKEARTKPIGNMMRGTMEHGNKTKKMVAECDDHATMELVKNPKTWLAGQENKKMKD